MTPDKSVSWDAVTVSELRVIDCELPEQTAPRMRISLQLSAQVDVEVGVEGHYERRSIGPGTFCITPEKGPVAAARWRGERRIVVAELSPALISSVVESHHLQTFELPSQHGISDPQVSHLMLALREELRTGNSSGQLFVDMIARAIVVRLLRAYAVSAPVRTPRGGGGLSRQLLRRVIEYVEAHLDQDLGLRSLAAVSGLSEDHFARAFRESTGVPPYRYLLQRRLARARQLLETSDVPIVEIAQALGFTDQSHLTRLFRRQTGMTPGQVRAHWVGSRDGQRKSTNGDTGIRQEISELHDYSSDRGARNQQRVPDGRFQN